MDTVVVETVNIHSDSRGIVYEPIGLEELGRMRNVHVVINQPGEVRGNHFHKIGTEIITLTGPARMVFRENNSMRDIAVPAHQVFRFTIPPNIAHAIQNTGQEPGILVAFNTIVHDRKNPDTVADILIPLSNY